MVGNVAGDIETVRPIRDGAIADLEKAEWMLRAFIRTAHGNLLAKPRVAVALSYGVNRTQRKALEDVVYRAGVRRLHTVDQAIAAAIGSGMAVAEPVGGLLVDVGAGTTTVAVLSMGGIVVSRSAPVGGDAIDAAIRAMLRHEHGLLVGDRLAESIKIELASAFPGAAPGDLAPAHGRDLATGLPRTVYVCEEDIRLALAGPLASIIDVVMAALGDCPPELAGDLVDSGMVLTGGGALLPGLDTLLQEETGIPVRKATNPKAAVVRGVARWLESAAPFTEVAVAG
jgi:rod shape-determining protein MreB